MIPENRLMSLKNKSALIAQRVEKEEKSPYPNLQALQQLKKQKLELKEIIAGIRQDSATH